ncbi:MAG TPA: response regulator transcription factor [bacterium]|nr:response regulator transcription factor [bacterium]
MTTLNQETKKSKIVEKKHKVFILDDHPILRHGLAQLINQQRGLEVCGEASGAEEAFAGIETEKPDIVVVDISLDGPNGIEFIKEAKEQHPDMLFLVHSMHDESLYAERALRAGARGYIMKQESPEKMVQAIRRILSGQIYMSDAMMEQMLEHRYNGASDSAIPMEALSDRELEVFQFIGKGETTARIANVLHRSVKTIETYRSRIKEKLNLKDNMQLIRQAMQWIQEGDNIHPLKREPQTKPFP